MGAYRKARPELGVDEGLRYIEQELDKRIASFSAAKEFYRRGSLFQTILAASLSAITVFIIGVSQIYDRSWLSVLALASASLTTIITAIGAWFGFHQLRVSNQMVLNQLYELRTRIEYDKACADGRFDLAQVDAYRNQYQAILTDANKVWEGVRSSQT